ncbi:MAG TPA: Crp/Fnr family transcriptional regulator [Myxococcota bacterium]|mgnify:CR=1 FL=1|nr:Crp/Fnr family transcriptional regulator [Myxococcota bacterium]
MPQGSRVESQTEVLEALRVLERWLEPRRYPKGRVLWNEGRGAGQLTVLDKGRVKILRDRPDGGTTLVFVLGPGEVFGFLPFVDGGPYPATAVALDDVEARVMSRERLLEVLVREPKVCLVLLEFLGRRLRDAFEVIARMSRRDAVGRVAAALVTLLPANARPDPLLIVSLPEQGYAFADGIGLTPETLSRALTALVRRGVLHRLRMGQFQVLDLDTLREMAAGRDPVTPGPRSVIP